MTGNQILKKFSSDQNNIKPEATTLFIIIFLLIIGLFGELLQYFNFQIPAFEPLIGLVNSIGRIWGIILLIKHGTLIKTRPFSQLILFFFGITIVGVLLKILHWPGSDILVIGLLGIPIIYAVRFMKKKNKNRLDILKVLWVALTYTGAILKLQHLPYALHLLAFENLVFFIMFVDFSYPYIQKSRQT